jgi:hypothetical protein
MNVRLAAMHSTTNHSFISNAQNYIANVSKGILSNIRKITPYIHYHKATEFSTVMAINLGFLHLSNKVADIAIVSFQKRIYNIPDPAKMAVRLTLKGLLVLSGMTIINSLMQFQLSRLYLTSSAILTIASQLLWQKISPLIKENFKKLPPKEIENIHSPKKEVIKEEPFLKDSGTKKNRDIYKATKSELTSDNTSYQLSQLKKASHEDDDDIYTHVKKELTQDKRLNSLEIPATKDDAELAAANKGQDES